MLTLVIRVWVFCLVFIGLAAGNGFAQTPDIAAELRIGLILPLTLPASVSGDFKVNQGMAEFCAAAKLAETDAQQAGIPVKLFYYDTYRTVDTLQKILALPELQTMDLLVGPIYAKETQLISRFAEANKIPLINPLTNQPQFDLAGHYTYLAEPSLNDLAAAALNFRNPGVSKKVACIYGTSLQDSALAEAFARLAKEAGCTMALFKKVAKNSAANLPKFLTEAALDSTSILFVPNEEPLVKAQLLSALEITRNPTLTITYGSWIEETETPLERFERLRIRFLYTDYAGYGIGAVEKIRTRIFETYALPATQIGLKAYDLIATLSNALAQAKPTARGTFLKDYSPLHSPLSAGYDYTLGQANARVPVYRILDGKLELE